MATFPAGIFNPTNPTADDTMDGGTGGPGVFLDVQISDLNNEVVAVETFVGTSSALGAIATLLNAAYVAAASATGFPVWMPAASGDLTGTTDTAAYDSLQTLVANGPARIMFRAAPVSAPYYMNATNSIYAGQLLLGMGEEATYISPGSSTANNLLFESNTTTSNTAFTNLVGRFSTNGPTGLGMCDMTIQAGVHQVGTFTPSLTPGTATVAQVGTPGSTTRVYKIEWESAISYGGIGLSNSVPSICVSTTSAATLNGTNYDTIALPSAPAGINGVRVSMSTSGGTGNYVVVYQGSYFATILVQSNTGLGFSVVPAFVNGTAGTVVGMYAQQMLFVNFRIRNAMGIGLWTEWASSANDGHDSNQMESTFFNVKIMNCGSTNWYFNGSHDSNLTQIVSAFGGQSDIYESNLVLGPSADGVSLASSHFWGGKRVNVVVFANGAQFDTNCQFEDSTVAQVWVMAAGVRLYGKLYNVGGNSSDGLYLGESVGGVTIVAGSVIADISTSDIGGHAVHFDVDGGSMIRMPDGGSAAGMTGIPNANTVVEMAFLGIFIYPVKTPTVAAGAVTVSAVLKSKITVTATTAITMSTTGAFDGMTSEVRIYDAGSAETLSWFNTENSTASAPLVSPGSATLPTTVKFEFNGATSKYRVVSVS